MNNNTSINRIAFIGNYLPRQCGIATFTTDLCEAVSEKYPETTCIALPVNDVLTGYAYPARVRFELTEKDIDSYLQASGFLNINNVNLYVCNLSMGSLEEKQEATSWHYYGACVCQSLQHYYYTKRT